MKRSLILSLSAPLVFILVACAPEHSTVSPENAIRQRRKYPLNPSDWPKNEWWKDYNDPSLIR
jgi:hypothetical protein